MALAQARIMMHSLWSWAVSVRVERHHGVALLGLFPHLPGSVAGQKLFVTSHSPFRLEYVQDIPRTLK